MYSRLTPRVHKKVTRYSGAVTRQICFQALLLILRATRKYILEGIRRFSACPLKTGAINALPITLRHGQRLPLKSDNAFNTTKIKRAS